MAERGRKGGDSPEQLEHVVLEMEQMFRHGGARVGTATQRPLADLGGRGAHQQDGGFAGGSGGSASGATMVDVHALESPDLLEERMKKKLENLPAADTPTSWSLGGRPCICRVPPSIRDQEKEAYEPRIVSIGPLHRGKGSLMPMEEVKLAYLRDLVARSGYNELGNYIRAIRECAYRARCQYAEKVDLPEDDFVEILVLDGCFIIEYLAKRVFKQTVETTPLSGVRWGFSHLRRDLMLLENQIPFFVLARLFENSKIPFRGTRKEPLTLMEMTLGFLDIKLSLEERPKAEEVLHLLHLYHLCLNPNRVQEIPFRYSCSQLVLWPFAKVYDLISLVFFGVLYLVFIRELPRRFIPSKKDSNAPPRMINCATELVEAGVHFKRKSIDKSKVNCFLKVSFTEGALEIPFTKVEESTSSKLRNLIALEQCFPHHVDSYFTSYGILMDNIINTDGDVAILRSAGIIESKLGSDAEVANMFNTLCKGTHIKYDTHYNAPLFRDVKEYCDYAHHRWRATLVHKYFGNPWTIISLIAGCLLLVLTAAQTYCTVFPRK